METTETHKNGIRSKIVQQGDVLKCRSFRRIRRKVKVLSIQYKILLISLTLDVVIAPAIAFNYYNVELSLHVC